MKGRSFIATLSAAATALALPFRAKAAPGYIMAVDPSTNPIWTNDTPDWHGIQLITHHLDGRITARSIPYAEFYDLSPATLGARAEQASPARASLAGKTLEA